MFWDANDASPSESNRAPKKRCRAGAGFSLFLEQVEDLEASVIQVFFGWRDFGRHAAGWIRPHSRHSRPNSRQSLPSA
jgi:hypothetical protein